MDETKRPHNLILKERSQLSVSQVKDVDTFDENKIVLFTEEETIEIEGYNLHIQKLDISSGELTIDGEVVSIVYSGMVQNRQKGFFKKLLK